MDPRKLWISNHFLLSDFLGNHSVYAKGYANPFQGTDKHLGNLGALCIHGLEPILESFGALGISYGYISPDLSAKIVKYQDPQKPSHHRFDLGAAADIIAHDWVTGEATTALDLYVPPTAVGSPIMLAHGIDYLDIPYSRLITYSESPYLCLALAAEEVSTNRPRKAFYENRYTGRAKAKPDYKTYSSPQARTRALELLQEHGLQHDWRGAGYPTYHGGGFNQYHHRRVSRYTMVSDWLFDLKSITNGAKNIPSLGIEEVQDAFAAAGLVYDWMVESWGVPRAPIVGGYVSHTNPYFDPENDWRTGYIQIEVAPPREGGHGAQSLDTRYAWLAIWNKPGVEFYESVDGFILASIDVEAVLNWEQ